jgi:hypothetical protein
MVNNDRNDRLFQGHARVNYSAPQWALVEAIAVGPEVLDVTTFSDSEPQLIIAGYQKVIRVAGHKCEYCGSRQAAERTHCSQCGAPL